ncbi:hypothetical protein E8E11_000441 [Didymella keratinophila]|nr:hypothetical protein E8E11_000441 [Didymella keratinophila]
MRAVTRSAASASARCSEPSRVKHVDHNKINFATLNDSLKESSTQVLSLPTLAVAKSLSQQTKSSTPPSTSLPWPVSVFAKTFEEDMKLDKFNEAFVHGEVQSKVARAWEPVEKEFWLERFGGPGRTIEKVAGMGTVVLRDVGEDGKAYLRVLI